MWDVADIYEMHSRFPFRIFVWIVSDIDFVVKLDNIVIMFMLIIHIDCSVFSMLILLIGIFHFCSICNQGPTLIAYIGSHSCREGNQFCLNCHFFVLFDFAILCVSYIKNIKSNWIRGFICKRIRIWEYLLKYYIEGLP